MTLPEVKDLSEIAKNLGQLIALGGGLIVFFKWVTERRDRATEVLLNLEKLFKQKSIRIGRKAVEDDANYEPFRKALVSAAIPDEHIGPHASVPHSREVPGIDDMLRFYVILCGVRKARQVPDAALSLCFRYWLAHYFHRTRREFKLYVHTYYPTLEFWLQCDVHRRRLPFRRSFFTPERFGWQISRTFTGAECARVMHGRVLVITGAGVSADSGIPTYRGADGYWRQYRVETLATLASFKTHPHRTWEWYCERRNTIRSASPNAAHEWIGQLAANANDFLLVTQNVDDLHERATRKISEERVVHIHGEIFKNCCNQCGHVNEENVKPDPLPACPVCASHVRPGVVWFDEGLEPANVSRIEEFLSHGKCDLVLIIGTSARFDYIVTWALGSVNEDGWIIEVNPDTTALTSVVDLHISGHAATQLPKLYHFPAKSERDDQTV